MFHRLGRRRGRTTAGRSHGEVNGLVGMPRAVATARRERRPGVEGHLTPPPPPPCPRAADPPTTTRPAARTCSARPPRRRQPCPRRPGPRRGGRRTPRPAR